MLKLLAMVAALAGCTPDTSPDDTERWDWHCATIHSCGMEGYLGYVELYDATRTEVQESIDGWTDVCILLTTPEVQSGECPFVLCAMVCGVVE